MFFLIMGGAVPLPFAALGIILIFGAVVALLVGIDQWAKHAYPPKSGDAQNS